MTTTRTCEAVSLLTRLMIKIDEYGMLPNPDTAGDPDLRRDNEEWQTTCYLARVFIKESGI